MIPIRIIKQYPSQWINQLRKTSSMEHCIQKYPHHCVSTTSPEKPLYKAKSALFVSNEIAQAALSSNIELDLGLENRIDELEILANNAKRRNIIVDLISIEKDFRNYQEMSLKLNKLNEDRKNVAKKMGELKKDKMNLELKKRLVSKGKTLKDQHKMLLKEYWQIEEKVMLAALQLPNMLSKDSPEDDKVIRSSGNEPIKDEDTTGFSNHVEFCKSWNLLKFCKFSPGGYYMRGDLAVLEQSILEFIRNEMDQFNYTSIICPDMFRTLVIEACGYKCSDPDDVFSLESKVEESSNKYEHIFHLCGPSLASFAAFLTKTRLKKDQLPLRLFTQGRSYAPVSDLSEKSLLNVQQQSTIHVCVVGDTVKETDAEFNGLIENIWNIYTKLELPIRLVNVSAKNLRTCEYSRYNLEVWMPSLGEYVTLAYLANYRDYVSRRLMITGPQNQHKLNIIHGQLVPVQKVLAAIIENQNQVDTKSLQVPKVLRDLPVS